MNLGMMALEEHKLDEAISELEKAVELNPQVAQAWLQLGLAQGEAGKYKDAADSFTSCLAADPDNTACQNNATLYSRKSQLLAPVLEKARETQGGDGSAPSLYEQAVRLRNQGQRDEEERLYRQCLKVDGRYAPCHWGLYLLYREGGKDKEAALACKNFLKSALADEFPKEVETCEKFISSSSYGGSY